MGIIDLVGKKSHRADEWLSASSPVTDHQRILSHEDSEYPYLLANHSWSPSVLMAYGAPVDNSTQHIAVIGTRNPTDSGKIATEEIAKYLAGRNLVVVSGMADGIDKIAHRSAILNGGKTIAVLGMGITAAFKLGNFGIMKGIAKNGTILSQFDAGQSPTKTTFPARNVIVAGMSDAILAVEMNERSGTRITIEIAIEMGRPVFLWHQILGAQKWAHDLVESNECVRFISSIEEALIAIRNKGDLNGSARN